MRLRAAILATCLALTAGGRSHGTEFMYGADVSSLPVFEQHGAVYTDDGVAGDALEILRNHGVNWYRVRLFVEPSNDPDPFVVQDLAYTIDLAKRIKQLGGKVLLDFHYSDTWADPRKQFKPAAWENLSFDDLVDEVYDYTRDSIAAFADEGVLPEMVQIGNEISNGLLWNDGRPWTGGSNNLGFDRLAMLLAAGIDGAKDGAGLGKEPLIMIHHDRGDRWNTTSYYFDKLVDRELDFDVIGYSYYPKWHYNQSSGAGSIDDVEQNLNNTANRYGKPVVIVETGFASRGAQFEPDYEFEVSEEGQHEFLETLMDVVQNVPNGLGQGVFWWYPEARPHSGLSVWENGRYGLFDQTGDLLPAAEAFVHETVEPIIGDYNGDGAVNAADFVVWRNTMGQIGRTLAADGDKNGVVGLEDYEVWRDQFGNANLPNGTVGANVPEPATMFLVLFAPSVIGCRRRTSRIRIVSS